MRSIYTKNADQAQACHDLAAAEGLAIYPIELDVTDVNSCGNAVDRIVKEQNRIDVVINNAGTLVFGITEAFTPEQVLNVFDVNTVGPLRVNRAVLPHMRKQRSGLLLYVGSVTSDIISPFQGPYVASKAAEDKLAETMHYELSRFGIDTAILQPGAYISGTNHFPGAQRPHDEDIVHTYVPIADLPNQLVDRLGKIVETGRKADVQDVANTVLRLVETPPGQRPFRTIVDPQDHGADAVVALQATMQRKFMERVGIADLMRVPAQGDSLMMPYITDGVAVESLLPKKNPHEK
ncbi:short-chain dehydrogenase reductase sdr [Leptolyngbya sp. Heron Island J]|nr:short-chain dehydrogenase reductase sdr [Leptolyngbya sp. Heron Island J]